MKTIQKALIYVLEHEDQAKKFAVAIMTVLSIGSLVLLGFFAHAYLTGTLGAAH